MSNVSKSWRAGYVRLAKSGELAGRVTKLDALLADCTVCPRSCHIDRRRELGECATGVDPVIASWNPHHGEEPVISCRRGSGTVFLANCNLRCAFCQNHDISQRPRTFAGRSITDEELAAIFIDLQDHGCHNINWVSPSHQVPQLVRALAIAAGRGLSIPIVYNTNAYDSTEVLHLLDGIVDIYMPDLKYADPDAGCRLSGVDDYPQRVAAVTTDDAHEPPAPEDLAAAIMGLVAENIALLSIAQASAAVVSRIVYGGSTLNENPRIIEIVRLLGAVMGFEAVVLPSSGHAGALGAMLMSS